MGLFSGLLGLFGGGGQKKAVQQSTDAIVSAINSGNAAQSAFQQQVRSDYAPYTAAGTAAVGQIGNFQGLNGDDARTAAFDSLRSDPRYTSLLTDGREALLQNGSATGGLRGGNVAGALAQLSPDVLSRVYDMVLGGLNSTAGLGIGAQGAVTQTGQNATNNITTGLQNIGQAQAGGILTKAGINSGNWSNLGGFLDNAIGAATGGGGFSLTKALGSIF